MFWKHFCKPDITDCPENFCSNWINKGDRVAEGYYDSVEEAIQAAIRTDESRCGWSLGHCKRIYVDSDIDYFEPNDRMHERCQLPIFYFIDTSKLEKLDAKEYEQYFSNTSYVHVEVELEFEEKYDVEKLRNSLISSVIILEEQIEIDNWSVLIEVYETNGADNTINGYMRFLSEEAPHDRLHDFSKFSLIGISNLIQGKIIGNSQD